MTNFVKQQMLRMETYAKFPYLIEVSYTIGDTDFVERFANCYDDVEFDGETYTASCFTIEPPEKSTGTISSGRLSCSAIDQTWITKIRQLSRKKKLTCRFVASIEYDSDGDMTTESLEDVVFTLRRADWNDVTISWDMIYDENMDIAIPCDVGSAGNVAGVA